MPAFREYNNGDALITAEENNNRNAQRGTMVRSGGVITIAASSSEPLLNIDETEIRVDGTDYTVDADSVALTPNATAYPRRDLVIARKGTDTDPAAFGVIDGDTISPELLARLQNPDQPDGPRIDDEGVPIHDAESIGQIQPPDATGLRTEATVLAMVYSPPGMADSTDIQDEFITDLRREGIGVGGVLRTGDAVDEVESHPNALDANITGSAASAAKLGEYGAQEYARSREILSKGLDVDSTTGHRVSFDIFGVDDSRTFGAYHVEVAGFGNFASNSVPFYISGDVAIVNTGSGYDIQSELTTAAGATNVSFGTDPSDNLGVFFDTVSALSQNDRIWGDLYLTRAVR